MEELFDAIEGDRKTASGRACVGMARKIWATGLTADGQTQSSSFEARAWIRLALEADKDDVARRLARVEERLGMRTTARETADRLKAKKKAVGDGTVVPFRGKDSI